MAFAAPKSILIVGSGVFGLSTAEALLRRPDFKNTSITVVDRGSSQGGDDPAQNFPARDAASIDASRIIRPDYADPAYAALANDAQEIWRGAKQSPIGEGIGADGRYTESGLVLVADHSPADDDATRTKKTGLDYVRESWENVKALSAHDPQMQGKIRELPGPEAIRGAIGTGGTTGAWGYINASSGWANAERAMAWMLERVQAFGRVQFVKAKVASLDVTGQDVTGVILEDGRHLTADLTVVATGAWTEALVGDRAVGTGAGSVTGAMAATGQVLGYVPFASAAERAPLLKMPVVLNLSTGLFIIPPEPDSAHLKVARHGYGYVNPTAVASSTPMTYEDDPNLSIPSEGQADLRRGLQQMVPQSGVATRPFERTRICWYTDTPTGDFVIDYHPTRRGLFVATGGSGHGFKFLPVLGDKIVDCITGNTPAVFKEKWAWKTKKTSLSGSAAASSVVTEDGSRGGKTGLVLKDEWAKDTKAKI